MKKILLVDDELLSIEFIKGFLDKIGYSSRCCASGKEALEVLKKERYDCVLLDICMGDGMDGVDTLYYIKEMDKSIKVIMVTGYIERYREDECMEFGADGYLIKPVNFKELRDIIKEVLGEDNREVE